MVVSFTIGRPFSRPANRKIPPWHGPAAEGCQRREPHFSPRLCDGNDRRGGETESYSAAFYGGILKRARRHALKPRDDSQRAAQSRASDLNETVLETRWLA